MRRNKRSRVSSGMRLFLLASALLLAACGNEPTVPRIPSGPPDLRVTSIRIDSTRTGDISLSVANRGGSGRARAIAWIRPQPLSTNGDPRQSCATQSQPVAAGATIVIQMVSCGIGPGGGPIGWVWVAAETDTSSRVTECYAVPGAPRCPFSIDPFRQ